MFEDFFLRSAKTRYIFI